MKKNLMRVKTFVINEKFFQVKVFQLAVFILIFRF